tara:strand:- start:1413 stop:1577 length:165 start_codon:yes stop_codon:yes gene_type:complete
VGLIFFCNPKPANAIKEGAMDPKDLAGLVINALELPRNIEVSEIVIKRNKANNP